MKEGGNEERKAGKKEGRAKLGLLALLHKTWSLSVLVDKCG